MLLVKTKDISEKITLCNFFKVQYYFPFINTVLDMGRDPSEEDVYKMISEVGCTNKDYEISKLPLLNPPHSLLSTAKQEFKNMIAYQKMLMMQDKDQEQEFSNYSHDVQI